MNESFITITFFSQWIIYTFVCWIEIKTINRNIFPKSNKGTELNSNTASIKINEGDLLIFPAYLPHSVEINNSNEDRVIVSFNLDILR